MSAPSTATVQFSIIGQPPSLLNRLASADPSALPAHWASSPSPPPSAPPETPRRPLGRPSLLEALTGEPSGQPVSSASTTIAAPEHLGSSTASVPLVSSDLNLFDVFSETLSKTLKSSQLQPAASPPSAFTAPTSFYFRGNMKSTPANAAGPSTSSEVPARHTTPPASSSTSAPTHPDAMQVDGPPHAMPSSSITSSRIPAEIKRHYNEHVELLTIRQTHQRVMDLHEELQGRHQDTMHAFEREKEQMQKLITVSAELFEKAGLLITRQEERWRDEEHDLQAKEQQEQEAQRLAAETEARAAEQRAREEQERERQRQEEERRRKEAEEDARRQEERRREEVERQRLELAKKQQEEAQRLADEKAREEAMEKERQVAEAAARQEEQERAAKESLKRQLEEADRLALEASRREPTAVQAQAVQAAVPTPNKASPRPRGAVSKGTNAPPESPSVAASNLPPNGLHLGEPTWTVGPSNSQRSISISSGIIVGTAPDAVRTPSQANAVPAPSMTLSYPEETTTLLFQATAERERNLAEKLRKGKGSKSPTSLSSAASPSTSVSSNNHAAVQVSNSKQVKVSPSPNNAPIASPTPFVSSQHTVSRQSAASPSTISSTPQAQAIVKPTKACKQKAPAVVLIKPEPTKSPVMSPMATKPPPLPRSSASANVPAVQPPDTSRAPPPTGLPSKATIVPPGPRKSTSSRSPDQVKLNGKGDRSVSSSSSAVNSPNNGRSTGGSTAQTTGKTSEQALRKHAPVPGSIREPPPHQYTMTRDHDDGWITTERNVAEYTAPRSPTPERSHYIPPSNTRRAPSPQYGRVSRDAPRLRRSPSPLPPISPIRKRLREDDFDPPPAQRPRYSDTNVPMYSPVERRAPPADVGRRQFRGPSPPRDRPHVSPTRGRSRSPRSHPAPSRRRSPPPPPISQGRGTYRPISPPIDSHAGRHTDGPPPYSNPYPAQYSPPPPPPPQSVPLSQRVGQARRPAPQSPEPREDQPGLLLRMSDRPPPSSAPRGMPNNSPSGSSPQTSRRGRGRGQRGRGGGSVALIDRMSNKSPKMSLESRLG